MPDTTLPSGGLRAGATEWLEYLAARALLTVLRLLPFPLARRLAEIIGLACGSLVSKWRMVAESNLRRAIPELSADERREVRYGVYRNLGRVVLALAKVPGWGQRELRQHVRFVGLEHFRAAEATGRGVMLLTAHLGNWELGALAHGAAVGPLSVMVRPIENRRIDRLIEGLRSAHGNRVISKRNAAREVLRALKEHGTVGILADQNAVADEAVFVEFFGEAASAHKGFAQLALRSGAAVLPAIAWWNGAEKRHIVEYGPALEVVRSEDSQSDVAENTRRFQEAIEERIRAHPDQWLWIHRRWKTRPPRSC